MSAFGIIYKHGNPTWISNGYGEKFVDDIADNLNRVIASLVADRIPHEKSTTGQGSCPPNFWVVLVQVRKSAFVDKLVEHMTYARHQLRRKMEKDFATYTAEVEGVECCQGKRKDLRASRRVCHLDRNRFSAGVC